MVSLTEKITSKDEKQEKDNPFIDPDVDCSKKGTWAKGCTTSNPEDDGYDDGCVILKEGHGKLEFHSDQGGTQTCVRHAA